MEFVYVVLCTRTNNSHRRTFVLETAGTLEDAQGVVSFVCSDSAKSSSHVYGPPLVSSDLLRMHYDYSDYRGYPIGSQVLQIWRMTAERARLFQNALANAFYGSPRVYAPAHVRCPVAKEDMFASLPMRRSARVRKGVAKK